jgi:hypothetical protein
MHRIRHPHAGTGPSKMHVQGVTPAQRSQWQADQAKMCPPGGCSKDGKQGMVGWCRHSAALCAGLSPAGVVKGAACGVCFAQAPQKDRHYKQQTQLAQLSLQAAVCQAPHEGDWRRAGTVCTMYM